MKLTQEALTLLGESTRRIAAALEIHRPCHDEDTAPWGCERGHYDDECVTGIPTCPAVCMDCLDGDDNSVPYPCPTARALGVPAPTTTEDTTS